jgi:hypothetical protein
MVDFTDSFQLNLISVHMHLHSAQCDNSSDFFLIDHLTKLVKFISVSKSGRAAMLLTCIRETTGSIVGPKANYVELFLGVL